MSNHKVPIFDLLKGQNVPYEGFGDVLPAQVEHENLIEKLISEAVERIKEGFGVELNDWNQAVKKLEDMIIEMWQDGWNPDGGNVNLFATDFGLLLTAIIKELYDGKTIFRSISELNHVSIWWSDKGLEVFPFHKAYKRLTLESGENLISFVQGLGNILEEE